MEDGVKRQTISFDGHILTSDRDRNYYASVFKDGRTISSLGCMISIEAGKGAEEHGILTFVPAFGDSELRIHQPDSLTLEISIPSDTFDELWAMAGDGNRLVLGGEVEDLPSKYSWALSPYVWDVDREEERHKNVGKFWFFSTVSIIQDSTNQLVSIRSRGDTLDASAAEIRAELEEKYPDSSQARKLGLQALEQAKGEAARQGLTGSDAKTLLRDAVELVATLQRSLQRYDTPPEGLEIGRLWQHQNIDKLLVEGREALGSWTISKDSLIRVSRELLSRPWLRLDEMEWIVVNALIFQEIFEFGETVKKGAGSFSQAWAYAATKGDLRRMGWAKLKISALWWLVRWGLVVVGMYGAWFFVERHHYEGISAFCILAVVLLFLMWLLVGFPVGHRAVKQAQREEAKLLIAMRSSYVTMIPDGVLSPHQIRTALLVAQERGAVWPSGTFALLDRAAMRDPPVWMT